MDWAAAGDVLPKSVISRLRELAAKNEGRAVRALAEAKRIREVIYEVFVALADGRKPPEGGLAALNAVMPEAFGHLRLKPSPEGFEFGWALAGQDLQEPLWPVIKSAADLLLSDAAYHVRECASETCGWLFVDLSKNKSRRWCDMRGCGNRAKIRRFRGSQD